MTGDIGDNNGNETLDLSDWLVKPGIMLVVNTAF